MYTLKKKCVFKLIIKFQNKAKIIKMWGNQHNNYFFCITKFRQNISYKIFRLEERYNYSN